jgi:uncharacterized cupin superfamily protein
MERC